MSETGILEIIMSKYGLNAVDANSYSPQTLAFIGDSIFGLVVKTVVTLNGNCPANDLNKKATKYVKAVSQAKIADYLVGEELLSEEEATILRRGRNAKGSSVAKNASVGDYRKATGLEALAGYLYLLGRTDRLVELIKTGMDIVDKTTE